MELNLALKYLDCWYQQVSVDGDGGDLAGMQQVLELETVLKYWFGELLAGWELQYNCEID